MPTGYFISSAAPSYTTTAGQNYPWSHSIAVPLARLSSYGTYPAVIGSVSMYLAAYSTTTRTANLTITPSVGTAGSFTKAVAVATSASLVAMSTTTVAKVSNTNSNANATISLSEKDGNSLRVGNSAASSGGITIGQSTGRKLWGSYTYYTVPATPTGVSVAADSANQKLTVSWSQISDWGDSSTDRQYVVRVSKSNTTDTNGNFSTTFTTATSAYGTSSVDISITGNTAATTYYVQVYAENEISSFTGSPKSKASATASVVLNPPTAAPTWSDNMGNTARVGVPFSGTATASSSVTLTLTNSNDLSDYGLAISKSSNTYTVSGRPTKSGTASLTMTATDTYSQKKDLANNITISSPNTPSITNTAFSNATANQNYTAESKEVNYAASISNISWSGSSPGLSISAASYTSSSYAKITLSGTPSSSAGGYYYFTADLIGFQDGTSTAPQTSKTFSVYVNPIPVPTWTSESIDTVAAINKQYTSSVSAENATSYSLIGAPSWLTINSSGVLSGTPTYLDATYGLSQASKSFIIRASGTTEYIETEVYIDVVHPIKTYKSSYGDFVYPETRLQRFDQSNGFTAVQWVRRRNDNNDDWEDIDIIP